MATTQISVQRFSVTSSKPFESILQSLDAEIGHVDMGAFMRGVFTAKSSAELEAAVQKAAGPSGMMEFARFNIGEVLRKENAKAAKSVRLVIGNPLIMKQMVVHVPDAASYAPVTILIDERADGVHLSYDRMASFLASYGNEEALRVARDLDSKIEALMTKAAG